MPREETGGRGTPARRRHRTADYLVERLAAGDLPAAEAADLRARLEQELGGPERLDALAADDAGTLERHPPRVFAAEVRRRERARLRAGVLRLAPALAAAAALLVAVPMVRRAPGPEGERVKGLAPHLVLHRRTATGAEVLDGHALGRAGDVVQIGYVSAGAAYGAILSIDGVGTVTPHWPAAGLDAAPLDSRAEVLLPASFRLDDAPGFERFFLVTSRRPFRVGPVLAAAVALAAGPDARHAPLELAGGLAQTSTLLEKEEP